MAWGENEKKMIRDMAVTGGEMLEAAGAKNVRTFTLEDRVPGYGIHEMGVARMGSDPKKSVLNQFQQSHDVKNLFVMDGAGFPSGGCQNPTLTIMALAVRSTDYLMEETEEGQSASVSGRRWVRYSSCPAIDWNASRTIGCPMVCGPSNSLKRTL